METHNLAIQDRYEIKSRSVGDLHVPERLLFQCSMG